MTPRYEAFMLAMAQRDQTLEQLALMAVVLVTAWVAVDFTPKRVQPFLHGLYLVGGLVLFLVQLGLCLLKG